MALTNEVVEKWLGAMASGRYKHGRNCLKNGDELCPLGMLLDIMGVKWEGGDYIFEGRKYGGREGLPLPISLMSSFHQNKIVRLNDINKMPLRAIITYVKENLLEGAAKT